VHKTHGRGLVDGGWGRRKVISFQYIHSLVTLLTKITNHFNSYFAVHTSTIQLLVADSIIEETPQIGSDIRYHYLSKGAVWPPVQHDPRVIWAA